ncbi:mediator complex subunit, variant 2 [Orbilia brochopaga]
MTTKAPMPRDQLAAVLISPAVYPTPQLSVDPRYLLYVQRLVSAGVVPLASFLHALLASDRQQLENVLHGVAGDVAAVLSREPVDTAVLTALVLVAQGQPGGTTGGNTSSGGTGGLVLREGPAALVDALSKWMDAVIAAGDGDALGSGLNEHGLDGLGLGGGMMGAQKKAVVGELVLAVGENPALNSFLKSADQIGKEKRAAFENTLPVFAQVFQALNPQLAMRLDALIPKKADAGGGNGLLSIGMGLDGMADSGAPTRGGLYVFLNSLLFARPLVDDEYLIHHLINRYKELSGQAALDLITASLDCIANAISRSESSSTISLFRHFLVNKIPLLLLRFNMPVMQAQYVLTQAISAKNAGGGAGNPLSLESTFGSADSMMLDLPNELKQEFLFACALHRIIEEASVEVILGDVPLQTMAKMRYTQEELVTECIMDSDRLERLISEIEELDGNSGAIVGAVVEMLRMMCEQRDTMGLYTLCRNLISKPKTIDLLLLYAQPVAILEPLCVVLENWRYEDDQGEYEPVYREFGNILLLVMTVFYRHNLNFSHLGAIPPTSFVPMFIKQCHKDISVDDLARMGDRHAQLGGWIKALYEGEGVTDEVMQSSRPQEYYSLVPTLIAQTVEACDRGILDTETLKGGLVYFQLSSYIASEVAIIFWLTDHIWATQPEITHALKILHILIATAPQESPQTHKTILAICAHNLERVLRDMLRPENTAIANGSPQHAQVEQMLKALAPFRDFRRSGLPSAVELDAWAKVPGGLLAALKAAVQGVVVWSAAPDMSVQPANYTPRLLYAAWRMLGAREVVRALVDEVQAVSVQGGEGMPEIAVDVVASMIVAPNPDDWRGKVAELTGRKDDDHSHDEHGHHHGHHGGNQIGGGSGLVTLVEALRYFEDDSKLSMEDAARGEVVVKLARRVESLLVVGNVAAGVAVGVGVTELANEVLGDVMADTDMFPGMGEGVDLGLTDELMTGM